MDEGSDSERLIASSDITQIDVRSETGMFQPN